MDAVVEESWREVRRGRLIDAAARVFGKRAFGEASMDEIAHEAGVGKPTLYRYFPSKDALFAAVFVDALDDLEARLDAVNDRESGAEARLTGLVAEIVPIFRDHLVPLQFLDATAASADLSKRRIFRERKARIGRRLAAALDEGVRRGELRPIDATRTAELVIGMVWSASSDGAKTVSEVAREVSDIVLRGVGRKDFPRRVGAALGPAPGDAEPVAVSGEMASQRVSP